jgi:hypothetical protein
MSIEIEQKAIVDEPPPALGTWPRVYAMVLVYLVVVIVTFYLITRKLAA